MEWLTKIITIFSFRSSSFGPFDLLEQVLAEECRRALDEFPVAEPCRLGCAAVLSGTPLYLELDLLKRAILAQVDDGFCTVLLECSLSRGWGVAGARTGLRGTGLAGWRASLLGRGAGLLGRGLLGNGLLGSGFFVLVTRGWLLFLIAQALKRLLHLGARRAGVVLPSLARLLGLRVRAGTLGLGITSSTLFR